MIILFLGGSRILHLSSLVGVTGILGFIMMNIFPYIKQRIFTLLNPSGDLQDSGYQINQSLITLGNGGFWGRGLANSLEKNLFLPDAHTDFVFSVAGEELGFIGLTGLLILFLWLYIRGIQISLKAPDHFGMLIGIGLATSVFMYVILNTGVVCGLLPVTGLPLPFMSYGGSAMIYNMIAVGIILNISKHSVNHKEVESVVAINA
jgi:cell division protein FtsW